MIALPPGRIRQLRCCHASGCRSAGGEELLTALREAAAEGGEAIAVKGVGCLRLCGEGPLVACDGPGGTLLFGGLEPSQARALVLQARASGEPVLGPADGAVADRSAAACTDASLCADTTREQAPAEPTPTDQPLADPTLAARQLDLEQPFFRLQRPLVLEHCGLIDPDAIDEALEHGAYSQLQRCLRELSPEQVRSEVRRSGLRGRGGAGYPTGLKWDTVALQPPGPRYVVCNADEGDPGAFMNRSVLEGDPHRLLEGIAIAAYAIGAARGYIYVRAEYPLAIARIRRAVEQARSRGLFGGDPPGGSWRFELEVRVGAGAYVCGEETALLASIQGRRGCPRPRPPFPAQAGLWGAPTLINNVETLATVPVILRLGADAYAAIGTPTSPGTKVFALSGAVRHTGLVEVPLGTSLRTIVETIGGGAPAPLTLPGAAPLGGPLNGEGRIAEGRIAEAPLSGALGSPALGCASLGGESLEGKALEDTALAGAAQASNAPDAPLWSDRGDGERNAADSSPAADRPGRRQEDSAAGAAGTQRPPTPAGHGRLKAVQTGGPSGGCIPADRLDTPVDYESLRQLGAMMGSGGMVVIDAQTPMPLLARHFMAFSVSESCGKCVPCRAGTVQLAALLDRFVEHRAEPADLRRLEELCAMVRDTSLCGLGQAAPSPVLSTLRWFRSDYEAGMAPTEAETRSTATEPEP